MSKSVLGARLLRACAGAILVAAILSIGWPVDAAAGGYKYATVLKTTYTDIEGISANIETANPTMRDDAGTHSIMQHWIGDDNNYVEIGWYKDTSMGQPKTWWGYHKNGVWQGYHWISTPLVGSTHYYQILWNSGTHCWNITLDLYTTTGPCDLPGPTQMSSTVQSGGEITYGGSPYWNAMGVSGDLAIKYKRVGQSWANLSRPYVSYIIDTVTTGICPGGGYRFTPLSQSNSWQASGCN